MLGSVIVSYIMPWRSSFPCHRMCCGPDTLLWFALSVFRVADMIGTDRHVSFLYQKKKKKKNMGPSLPRRHTSTHAWHQACDSTSECEGHEQA